MYQWIILITQISLLNKSHFFWSYHPEMEELLALLLTHPGSLLPCVPPSLAFKAMKRELEPGDLAQWSPLEFRLSLPGSV